MSAISTTTAPPAIRNHPVFQKVLGQLTTTQRVAREAKEEARQAVPPVVAMGCAVMGGAATGLLHTYLPTNTAAPASVVTGVLGVVAGAVMEIPELGAIGNGMLAAMTAQWVHGSLTAAPAAPASTNTKEPPPAA